jgi:hypothetical protein
MTVHRAIIVADKCLKVIDSCKTQDHLQVAGCYVNACVRSIEKYVDMDQEIWWPLDLSKSIKDAFRSKMKTVVRDNVCEY